MKFRLVSICLFVGYIAIAQPSQEEVVKHKIKKVTLEAKMDETIDTEVFWYDRKGNDSLRTNGDNKIIFKNEYQDGRLMSSSVVDQTGAEKDLFEYTYSADGSYKKTRTDAEFKMKSHEWFSVKNKITKSQSPDGNTLTYTYDAKGKLTSITSDGANGGVKVKRTYLYDVKGNKIKEDIDIDGSKATTTYFYNAKNQLTREINKGESWGTKYLNTIDYTYNSKGLVSKKIETRREDGAPKPVISTESFTYEHY